VMSTKGQGGVSALLVLAKRECLLESAMNGDARRVQGGEGEGGALQATGSMTEPVGKGRSWSLRRAGGGRGGRRRGRCQFMLVAFRVRFAPAEGEAAGAAVACSSSSPSSPSSSLLDASGRSGGAIADVEPGGVEVLLLCVL
jgi:hypothetical protein